MKALEDVLSTLTELQWFNYIPNIRLKYIFYQYTDCEKDCICFDGETWQIAYEKMVKFNKESEIN